MKITNIPFGITDWSAIPVTEHEGVRGKALWRTQHFGDIRVRMVEYAPGYLADGRKFVLTPGISYQVADQAEAHRSSTETGAKLFIVD